MLYKNRDKFKKENESFGKIMADLPIAPNTWTRISLVFAAASAYSLYIGDYPLSLLLFALAGLCDLVDGAVARARNTATVRGAYLDTIADRYVEFMMIFALYLSVDASLYIPAGDWLMLALFGSLMTTYVKAAAKEKGIDRDMRGGLMERAERIIVILLIIIAEWQTPLYSIYLIAAFAILTNLTAFQRIRIALYG